MNWNKCDNNGYTKTAPKRRRLVYPNVPAGITISNRVQNSLNTEITLDKRLTDTREVRLEIVKMPIENKASRVFLQPNNEVQIIGEHLKGKTFSSSTLIVNVKGEVKPIVTREIKID